MKSGYIAWRIATALLVLGAAQFASAAECDKPAGEKAFVKCAACHSLEKGKHLAGPSLANLIGRKAGSVEGFLFSFAMEQSDITWNIESLDAFLKSPMQYIPGMVMPFGGLRDDAERQALVCWLAEK